LTSNGSISGYNNRRTKNPSMSYLLKNWYSINQTILLFETINYDIQKHSVLYTLIDESIIPGVGQ